MELSIFLNICKTTAWNVTFLNKIAIKNMKWDLIINSSKYFFYDHAIIP